MISGILHSGSGLGNQLHRYVATRVLALDKGYDFSVFPRSNFKGGDFINLDMGEDCGLRYMLQANAGKVIPVSKYGEPLLVWQEKTNYYNPEFNFIEDESIIDGEFQSEQYFGHRLNEIDEWLKVEPLDMPNDLCVIGFRGGEYYLYPELGLPKEYFDSAIKHMGNLNPAMRFQVHTDDSELASKFFPDFPIIQDIGINWRSMRYAKYAIIANSSFYILPRLLAGTHTIAPRGWARRNVGEWSRPDNFYRQFKYV